MPWWRRADVLYPRLLPCYSPLSPHRHKNWSHYRNHLSSGAEYLRYLNRLPSYPNEQRAWVPSSVIMQRWLDEQ
jgi:hypothetical protein